ncbi:MAG: glutaredoxin family protein [Candidatus Thalassarchaeaceae archaeon]
MFTDLLEQHQGNFLVFTGRFCGYCTAAKRLLTQKEQPFVEISFDESPAELRDEVVQATMHRTVPVIFDIREEERIFIGGFDELSKYPING